MKRRSNRFLMWALALSLAAHAVVIYWAQGIDVGHAYAPDPAHPVVIEHRHPKPPPPPLVIVTPEPIAFVRPAKPHQHLPPTPPKLTYNSPGQPGDTHFGPITPPIGPIGPDPGPTGPVEPTTAPGPVCTAPDVAARALDPVTPDTPELAQEQGLTGTTQVKVTIDVAGAVTDVSVYRSSGSTLLDAAALRAARESTYKADIRNCEAVSGSYLFTATFQ